VSWGERVTNERSLVCVGEVSVRAMSGKLIFCQICKNRPKILRDNKNTLV